MKLTQAIVYVAYKEGPVDRDTLVKKVAELLKIEEETRLRSIRAWIGKLLKLCKNKNTAVEVEVDGRVKRLQLVEEGGKLKAVEV